MGFLATLCLYPHNQMEPFHLGSVGVSFLMLIFVLMPAGCSC